MNHKKFREKSLKKYSSSESTDDYIRTAGIHRGLVLGAVILLVAAGILWGAMLGIESGLSGEGVIENEQITTMAE